MSIILAKISAGVAIVLAGVAGLFNYDLVERGRLNEVTNQLKDMSKFVETLKEEMSFGSYLPVAGGFYKLAGSGIGTTDTSIVLQSFTEPMGGQELAMADFGTIAYATLEPGTSKKEFISFTSVTQDSGSTEATLGGVTRGLTGVYPFTASTTIRQSHSGGSRLIISNPPQHYQKYAGLDQDASVTATWIFSSTTLPRLDNYVAPSIGTQFTPKTYVDTVATSGAAFASTTVDGIVEIARQGIMNKGLRASTTGATYVIPNELLASSSNATSVPFTGAAGTLSPSFIATSSDYKWSGTSTFTGPFTTTATATMATATITNLNVSATSTLTGTTTFGTIPTLPTATATTQYQIPSVAFVASSTLDRLGDVQSVATSSGGTATTTATSNLFVNFYTTCGGSCLVEGYIGTSTTNMWLVAKVDADNAADNDVSFGFFVPKNYTYAIILTGTTGSPVKNVITFKY